MIPTQISASMAIKLGSLIVHIEEALAPGGHGFDLVAVSSLIADPEVRAFLAAFGPGLLPKKRLEPPEERPA